MLYLYTNCKIIIKLITIGAAALVTANRIDAGAVAARRRVAFVLVDALIVIKMLNKAVRTSAAITPHEILEIRI